MIAIWIIAFIFTLVGGLICFPHYHRFFTCSGRTQGTLLQTAINRTTGRGPIQGRYEYWVDGVRYEKSTSWSTFFLLRNGQTYTVHYDPRRPQRSFIPGSGIYFNCILGTLFFLTGIGSFALGLFILTIL